MKAITPFGTDERTGPRALTLDITPLAPLLTGTKYMGVLIDTYDLNGWYADGLPRAERCGYPSCVVYWYEGE